MLLNSAGAHWLASGTHATAAGAPVRGRLKTRWKADALGSLAGGSRGKRSHLPLRQVIWATREKGEEDLGRGEKEKGPKLP